MAEVDRSLRDVALLHESSQLILAGGDLETVLHQILLIVRNYFSVVNCAVFLTDESGSELYCKARNGYTDARRKFRVGIDGVIGWAAKARQPVSVPDVHQEPRYLAGDPTVQSELALPLLVRGALLGVLDVESDCLNFFTPQIVQVLSIFAGQAAIAIDSARLHKTERRRMHQIELINLIARSATSTQRTRDLLLNLCELISDAFEGADVAILMAQPDDSLTMQARVGNRRPERQYVSPVQRAALLNADSLTLGATTSPDRTTGCYGQASHETFVPLISCGEMLGGILLVPADGRNLGEEDLAIAQAASDVCASAIKNVQLAEELHRVANTDFLTGVHNERYFYSAMEMEVSRAKRYRKSLTCAILDLRNFQQINEMVGYDGGDTCLRDLARAVQIRIRSNDIVCRFGGDRFALLFPESDSSSLAAVTQKLRAAVSEVTYGRGDERHHLDATIVTATYPADGSNAGEIVQLLLARLKTQKQHSASATA